MRWDFRGFWRFGSLQHWPAETSWKLICPCALNPSQELDRSLCFVQSQSLMQPRVNGLLKSPLSEGPYTHNDSTTSREGLCEDGGTCWGGPQWNLRPSTSTFSLSTLSHFSPVLEHILLTPLPNDCSQSITEVCRVTLCLPVPGFFSGSGQLDWFKACHRLSGIWSSTFLQLPGMLLSNPSSYQEDEKRGIFLSCHTVVAQWHCGGLTLVNSQQGDFVPTETQEDWPGEGTRGGQQHQF